MKQSKVYKLTCHHCKEPYYARSLRSKYCCPAHQVAAYRASHAGRQSELEKAYLAQQEVEEILNPTKETQE
ncbi:hypothetical protein D3C85_1755720 [compost metagenome]